LKALVTGGAGFIGSHIAERLLSLGYQVRVLDNFATGRRTNLAGFCDEIELIEGDIQSYERASKAAKGCEVVFHQAALPSVPRSIQDPLTSNATNVIGTLNVLLAARDHDVRRVIYASSSSAYGRNPELPKREDLASEPISPYATAKLAAEGYCRSFTAVYGLETVALRYFNVFGPRQDPQSEYAAVIPRFITTLSAGAPPVIFGDGQQSRDFTYVDNVVDANISAADARDVAGRTINVACGQRITLNELVAELQSLLGTRIDIAYAAPRSGDVRHSLADIGLARSLLGYEPRIPLREGLRRTIASLLDCGSHPVDAGLER
jgi:UDP-glucose 4-epimerase